MIKLRKQFLFFSILSGTIILDQWTKKLAISQLPNGDSISVFKGLFYLTYTTNKGAVFGMLKVLNPIFFIIMTFALISLLLIFLKKLRNHPGFAVLLGGIIGNLIDRIRFGYTVDFIDFRFWPVFNISDICLCTGVALLFLQMIKDKDVLTG